LRRDIRELQKKPVGVPLHEVQELRNENARLKAQNAELTAKRIEDIARLEKQLQSLKQALDEKNLNYEYVEEKASHEDTRNELSKTKGTMQS